MKKDIVRIPRKLKKIIKKNNSHLIFDKKTTKFFNYLKYQWGIGVVKSLVI